MFMEEEISFDPLPLEKVEFAPSAPDLPKKRGWIGAAIIRLLSLSIIILALNYSFEGITSMIILFILIVPFEKIFPRHRGQKVRRPLYKLDMSYAMASPLLNLIGLIAAVFVGVISLAWIPGLLIRPLVEQIPAIILPFVGFLLFDLMGYWTHRFYHEIPVLWKFHAVHHSTEHLDWASGFRAHPFDGTLIAPAFFFLIAAGFTAELTGLFAIIQILLGLFLHANVRFRLRWLHPILGTPEMHHWHHSNEPEAIWTNYGVVIPLWDQIFGTYNMPRDKRPSIYGVDEYIEPNMVDQLLYPLQDIGKPWNIIRHPFRSTKVGFVFYFRLLKRMKWSLMRPRGMKPPT
jgi:sterol desaturase/sphingolipid hydroxylase (fatty acid hydroxylase superfamily)